VNTCKYLVLRVIFKYLGIHNYLDSMIRTAVRCTE